MARGSGESRQRRNATTGQRGATCNRQSDRAYTQVRSASSSVPIDRRIEEKVMARKKDKQTQKDKKPQSAQGAPAEAETAVAPSASPRPKKKS